MLERDESSPLIRRKKRKKKLKCLTTPDYYIPERSIFEFIATGGFIKRWHTLLEGNKHQG